MENRKKFTRIPLDTTPGASQVSPFSVWEMDSSLGHARKSEDTPDLTPEQEARIRQLEQRQADLEQAIADMEDRIDDLELNTSILDSEEPEFPDGLIYAEWEDHKAELEDALDDLEAELDELQDALSEVVSELEELRG